MMRPNNRPNKTSSLLGLRLLTEEICSGVASGLRLAPASCSPPEPRPSLRVNFAAPLHEPIGHRVHQPTASLMISRPATFKSRPDHSPHLRRTTAGVATKTSSLLKITDHCRGKQPPRGSRCCSFLLKKKKKLLHRPLLDSRPSAIAEAT
ncbi:hypothetical protein TIFTF001_030018 [Ficus carica]|uniref:Uncharacterized protein n=1 Tax=Ficus carica TaxID=3494 RepID=A0AA88DT11_FICCA|nr:hypothetical protein TIFTF001_030018 [Ficus carica]